MPSQDAFNLLSLREKIVYVNRNGAYLALRFAENHSLKLYYLNNYFVEAYYSLTASKYMFVVIFADTLLLWPYLKILN